MLIDPVMVCRRYIESSTPEILIRFEKLMAERFGNVPATKVPAEEAMGIWQQAYISTGE